MLSFSGSRGPHGPDLPSPFGRILQHFSNNRSLDRFSQESFSYQFGSEKMKTLFVDDISDPNSCKTMATLSNKVLEDIKHQLFLKS